MKQTVIKTVFLWLVCFSACDGGDRFSAIKEQLSQATCVRFEFISIIKSDIFDVVDSMAGAAYIAHDGRFNVTIGEDRYLFDMNFLYSYSAENNQVVIEKVQDIDAVSREISFITRLDELYETKTVVSGRLYRLNKKPDEKSDIPDSVTVFIDEDTLQLERLEYYDINEELNVIVIRKQQASGDCDERRFEPVFPDSVERVRL